MPLSSKDALSWRRRGMAMAARDGQERDEATEARRLALVRRLGLLDTPADERFDVFTRLAASVAGTPVATISLIDEKRVWFKSSRGLPEGVTEVPRDIAACAHVLDSRDGPLVISDTREDARVANSPLVTGPFGMRFYAGAPLRGPGGEVLGSLCVIDRVPREATPEMIAALEDLAAGVSSALRIHEMSELALKDPLTGLGNRRILDEGLATMVEAARKPEARRAVGVLMLDLDGFRQFNEMLGHDGGDTLLREVGQRLALRVREDDVAARLGGDEFALVVGLRDTAEIDHRMRELGERVLDSLRAASVQVEGHAVPVRGSVGVAWASHLGPGSIGYDARALMRAADAALYRAKHEGRDRVAVACAQSARGMGSKLRLAHDLREALAADGAGMQLAFQPLHACGPAATLNGFEALLRWRHPAHGAISPADFIPVAERSGLAGELDRWVLREACRQAMRLPGGRQSVAVNITPSFLIGPEFLDAVDEALARSGLPPSRLCIELTERVFLNDREPASRVTQALLARGVQVALDDFGAGHASFGYLADIAATKVKVDGALIAALDQRNGTPERATAIIRGVIGMARDLGIGVVAEGVETPEQLDILRDLGCDEVQGWHLGRPAEVGLWIERLGRPALAA